MLLLFISWIPIFIMSGIWSEGFLMSGRISCWLNPLLCGGMNTRSRTEFVPLLLSAYLVGTW